MTPKDKAEELVLKFYWRETDLRCSITDAKQCALIAVDELIEALHEHHWQNRLIIDYWNEVKHEIEKL